MSERSSTSILFVIGIGLIVAAAAIYGVLTLLGVSFAVGETAVGTGTPFYLIMALPALVFAGLTLLFIKVIIDRVTSKEDSHYSRTVDK